MSVPPPARGWSPDERGSPACAEGSPASAGMVPAQIGAQALIEGFPRQRGDGPVWRLVLRALLQVPPPARGWSQVALLREEIALGSPASAGMVLVSLMGFLVSPGFPRQRGDGPDITITRLLVVKVPPPARGWSEDVGTLKGGVAGSPASAGMVPARSRRFRGSSRFPRQRGDGPGMSDTYEVKNGVPPPARGWSDGRHDGKDEGLGSPASAGMVPDGKPRTGDAARFPRQRGDGPCNRHLRGASLMVPPPARGWSPPPPVIPPPAGVPPPARGWSVATGAALAGYLGSPASAGMVPGRRRSGRGAKRFPRQRGDGPSSSGATSRLHRVPPPARGWSLRRQAVPPAPRGSPASAGMVPRGYGWHPRCRGFPSQRGDGPFWALTFFGAGAVPPPARGWSARGLPLTMGHCGSPASAGMVPRRARIGNIGPRFPRQRGDGPSSLSLPPPPPLVPPPARGWSSGSEPTRCPCAGSPASAGMVP